MQSINRYANWYRNDREFLQRIFGNDRELIAALLAATSPQVTMLISWRWTLQIYKDYIAGRKVKMHRLHKCHRRNVLRALAGEQLSGRKVRNFYKALTGDTNAVVLDLWMLRLIKYYPRHTHNPQGRRYDRLADRFRARARANGYEPVEFQAILWINYRLQHGYEPVSYSIIGQDKSQYTFADLY